MQLPPHFWSCDWGTSSFRLRLVRTETLEVLGEGESSGGARAIYERALAAGKSSEAERAAFFAEQLREQIDFVRERSATAVAPAPLVISGMASSTIGWKELPYATLPFGLDARDMVIERLAWEQPGCISETFLVSGIASERDMMRGEETEAIGIFSFLARSPNEGWLVLPGTHSKHLQIREGALRGFYTYMTGELFDLLGRQSILKASVEVEAIARGEWNAGQRAFREGVERAGECGVLRALFQTRTRAVLQKQAPAENAWFLSGVLIGTELEELPWKDAEVMIGGAGRLPMLYREALEILSGGKARIRSLSETQSTLASVAGHRVVLKRVCV